MYNYCRDALFFFYPSRLIGGAEYLFARLALFIKKNYNIDVYYIDYRDGFIRNQEFFKELVFLDFEDNKKTILNKKGTLITPISNIYRILDYVDIKNLNLKLFFWCIHPYNIVHVSPEAEVLKHFTANINKYILRFCASNTYNVFKVLLKLCHKYSSIYYMDYDNYIFNYKIWGDIVQEKFLKIASKDKSIFAQKEICKIDEINVAVIGRLVSDKISSVLNILKNLNNLQTNKRKILHIIGEGPCKNKIIPDFYPNVVIKFTGTLLNEELDIYLVNNVDILFAMGTCCFEGAALKLPVVVLPYCLKNYSCSKFFLLGDNQKYAIGAHVDLYKKYALISFKEIIDSVYNNDKKNVLGENCYNYFIKNYSLQAVSKNLLNFIKQDNLTVNKYIEIKQNAGKLCKNKSLLYKILKGIINVCF